MHRLIERATAGWGLLAEGGVGGRVWVFSGSWRGCGRCVVGLGCGRGGFVVSDEAWRVSSPVARRGGLAVGVAGGAG